MSFFAPKGGHFWNVAVGAALISAGYLAAKFSSGEEEYEESHNQPIYLERSDSSGNGPFVQQARGTGDVYVEDAPLDSNEVGSSEDCRDYQDYPHTSGGTGDSSYFNSSVKPIWVDDLLRKLELVDEKLNDIKDTISARNQSASVKGDGDDNDNDTRGHAKITDYLERVDHVPELEEYEAIVKQKVQAMQYDKEFESASSSGSISGSIGALLMYIAKLVEQPTVPRYRRISVTNQTYKTLIAPLKGHDEFLKAVGFSKKGTCFEWMDASPTTPTSGEKERNEEEGGSKWRVDKLSSENRLLLLKRSIDLLKALSKE